jgi:hypothetical protein
LVDYSRGFWLMPSSSRGTNTTPLLRAVAIHGNVAHMMIRTVGFLVVATTVGCAVPNRERIDQEKRVECSRKAAFDLGCPEDQLKFQCLADGGVSHGGWSGMIACTSWGVTGCDKKATYVLTNLGWVNNTGVQSPSK